jgi:hypothetical protein
LLFNLVFLHHLIASLPVTARKIITAVLSFQIKHWNINTEDQRRKPSLLEFACQIRTPPVRTALRPGLSLDGGGEGAACGRVTGAWRGGDCPRCRDSSEPTVRLTTTVVPTARWHPGICCGHAGFVAVDNPHANKLTVHILAAVAQHEREMIAQRTKDALQAAKARGVVLGNPRLADVRDRAVANLKADADRFARNVAPIIREIQSTGVASHRGIARSLNARGVATARGGEWTAVQVGSILRRVAL